MGEQTAIGFFKRWVRGTALCRIPFYDNFRKLFNILETIEGRNGIKILKPTGNDGFGWTITKDYDKSDLPAGDSTNVALKWSEADLSWKAVLPVEVENDEQSGALGEDDRVVTGIKTGSDGKLLQLITKPLGPSGGIPDGISLENNGDGKLQIMEWDGTANGTANGISKLLKADPKSGELSAFGDSGRYELLCRVGGPGGPVGYMPIGEGDGSDPEDPNAAACDQNTHPASGGGGGGEEEDDDHPQDEDEEHPGEGDHGTGGDTGNTQHPAADDCYTTAA